MYRIGEQYQGILTHPDGRVEVMGEPVFVPADQRANWGLNPGLIRLRALLRGAYRMSGGKKKGFAIHVQRRQVYAEAWVTLTERDERIELNPDHFA